MSGVFGKNITDWMNDSKVPNGATHYNRDYIIKLYEIDDEFAKNNVMLYLLLTEMQVWYCKRMLVSGLKQRGFISAAVTNLKHKALTEKWIPIFNKDIKMLERRVEHVRRIVKEDLWLTEYHPYFNEIGFDKLIPETNVISFDMQELVKPIIEDMRKWNETHKDIVEKHMQDTEAEREALKKHKEKVIANVRAEKAEERAEKKALRDEIKEIKKNAEADRRRRRKIEKEMEQYYK